MVPIVQHNLTEREKKKKGEAPATPSEHRIPGGHGSRVAKEDPALKRGDD